MILIVGLGNPGKKFQKTRHNIGFRIVEKFARKNNFPEFQFSKKFNALISKGSLNNKKILVAKPQTFMNKSGEAVKSLIENCKLKIENLFVIHDDLDISLGKIRIIKNRGSAGHKGVESIIRELKTKDFVRFRIGIRPGARKPKNVEKFVLQKFNKDEEKILKEVIKKTVRALEFLLKEEVKETMIKFNK